MIVHRIATITPAYSANDLSGEGAKASGGRWNSPGAAMVYCAENRALAILETFVHVDKRNIPPMNRYFVTIDLPDDEARFAILKRYIAPFVMTDVALDTLCELTSGATPALLRQLMEGVKRDLVLGARFRQALDAKSVFSRIVAVTKPHADAVTPHLWDGNWALDRIAKLPWPPERAPQEEPANA